MSYFIIFIIPASSESHQNKTFIISYLAISMGSYCLVDLLLWLDQGDTPPSARYSLTSLPRWGERRVTLSLSSTDPLQSMKRGDPFPIWGTCNGFELLSVLSSDDEESSRLTRCQSENLANPLHLFSGWEASEIYGSVGFFQNIFYVYLQLLQAPEDILRKLTKEKVTINFHENCLTPSNFTKYIYTTLKF